MSRSTSFHPGAVVVDVKNLHVAPDAVAYEYAGHRVGHSAFFLFGHAHDGRAGAAEPAGKRACEAYFS